MMKSGECEKGVQGTGHPTAFLTNFLILALHRLRLRSRQRFRWLAWLPRRCWRSRSHWSHHRDRPFADLNLSFFAVHDQLRTVRSDRTTGTRFPVVSLNFDFVELALDFSFTRARLNFDRRIGRNRN